jgi:hypothetical protein
MKKFYKLQANVFTLTRLMQKINFKFLALFILLIYSVGADAQILQRGDATNAVRLSTNMTTFQINKPEGVIAGDLLIANFVQNETDNDNGGLSNVSLTGWTLFAGRQIHSQGTNNRDNQWFGTLLYRVADGTEGNSFTFNTSNRADMAFGTIVAFSGVDCVGGLRPNGTIGGPFDVVPSSSMSVDDDNNPRVNSITTTTNNAAVLMFVQANDNNTFASWSAESTSISELYNFRTSDGDDAALGAAWGIKATAGAVGLSQVVMSASDRWAAIQVALRPKPACPSTIQPGQTTSSVATACIGEEVQLSLQNSFANTAATFQWQSTAVGSTSWTAIGGATSSNYNFSFSSMMQYRCVVSCDGSSANSTPIIISASPFLNCYCAVTATSDDGSGVTQVDFNTISNASSGNPSYTSFATIETSVVSGESYPISVRVNTGGNYAVGASVWFDWNQNGLLEEVERTYLGFAVNETNGLTSLSQISITIPADALIGETLMRVRASYFYDTYDASSCGNQNWSEAEDYKIIVQHEENWIGVVSSQWDNASNWENGNVPGINTKAIIKPATFQPEVTTNALAAAIYVQEASTLKIMNNASLTVLEAITVENGGDFIVKNGANLVQIKDLANSGAVRVEKTTRPLMRQDYVIWSSPVQGTQTLKQFSPQTLDNRFYDYDITNNVWAVTNNQIPFNIANGYLIRLPNNHPIDPTPWTGEFNGVPNNGTKVVSMPAPRSGNQNRYFLVGNPYPSAIDMQKFLEANESSITGVFYIFRKTNGVVGRSSYFSKSKNPDYDPANPGSKRFLFNDNLEGIDQDVIPSGQGFFVEMIQGASQVIFTNEMRVADNAGILNRNSDNPMSDRYTLELSDSSDGFSQMQIGHYNATTLGYDAGYDATVLGNSGILLGSLIEDVTDTFAVQAINEFDVTTSIPLRFKTQVAGEFTIELKEVEGLFMLAENKIYIEDTDTGVIHDFSDGAFVFTAESGDFTSRFKIVYQQSTLNIISPENTNGIPVVFAKNQEVNVKVVDSEIKQITVYTLDGKMHASQKYLNSISQVQLPIHGIRNQVIIIQLLLQDGTSFAKKVYLD